MVPAALLLCGQPGRRKNLHLKALPGMQVAVANSASATMVVDDGKSSSLLLQGFPWAHQMKTQSTLQRHSQSPQRRDPERLCLHGHGSTGLGIGRCTCPVQQ